MLSHWLGAAPGEPSLSSKVEMIWKASHWRAESAILVRQSHVFWKVDPSGASTEGIAGGQPVHDGSTQKIREAGSTPCPESPLSALMLVTLVGSLLGYPGNPAGTLPSKNLEPRR